MEQNYTITHFQMMRDISTKLVPLSAEILEHNYNHEAFGSWWFTFKRAGREFRIVFDGRDQWLYLQDAADDFRDMKIRRLKRPTADIMVSETCSLVKQKT